MFYETANSSLVSIKMCASTVHLGQFTPHWTLLQIADEEKPRQFVHRVVFDTPFSNIPVVHVGLSGFDIDNRDSARISVRAGAINSEAFDIVINTWCNTRIYNIEISWLALGQG